MSSPPMLRPEDQKKLAQLRIEVLKKEEEEEQWISGEELFTEGSSDEDDAALRAKRRERGEKGLKKHSRSVATKIKKQTKDEKLKLGGTLPPPNLSLPADTRTILEPEESKNSESDRKEDESSSILVSESNEGLSQEEASVSSLCSDEDEETKAEISWRPKRGMQEELVDAEKAYLEVVEKVNQLKNAFGDWQKFPSQLVKATVGSHASENQLECAHSSGGMEINPSLSDDWDLLNESSDVDSALINMKKLDILLDMTALKEKEARDKTMHVQQDVRQKLDELCENQGPVDGELAKNTAHFRQLWSSSKLEEENHDIKIPDDVIIVANIGNCDSCQPVSAEELTFPQEPEIPQSEIDNCMKGKDEQPLLPKSKKNFVKRNIELAACGRGVLSITESEKQRLKNLLRDVPEKEKGINHAGKAGEGSAMVFRGASSETKEEPDSPEVESYALVQVKQTLQIIDDKLKAVCGNKEIVPCLDHLNEAKRDWKEFQEQDRLFAIDGLLAKFSHPFDEEVEPLAEEEIKSLVNTCKNDLLVSLPNKPEPMETENAPESPCDEPQQKMTVSALVDHTVIKSLVENAKSNMPLFKFRNTNAIEKIERVQ